MGGGSRFILSRRWLRFESLESSDFQTLRLAGWVLRFKHGARFQTRLMNLLHLPGKPRAIPAHPNMERHLPLPPDALALGLTCQSKNSAGEAKCHSPKFF